MKGGIEQNQVTQNTSKYKDILDFIDIIYPKFFKVASGIYTQKIYKEDNLFFSLEKDHRSFMHQLYIRLLKREIDFKELGLFLNEEDFYNFSKICRNYFDYLDSLPLGSWDKKLNQALYNHLITFQEGEFPLIPKSYHKRYIKLRFFCEQYALVPTMRTQILKKIEAFLNAIKTEQTSLSSQNLPYKEIYRSYLIKVVYLFEDEALINLFSRYLPIPGTDLFGDKPLPRYIAQREAKANEVIAKFIERNKPEPLPALEQKIIQIQRLFRSKQRKLEENARIPKHYPQHENSRLGANILYIPQKCSDALSQRIVKIAASVKFMTHIRHETKKRALVSIFDAGLYGRRSLMASWRSFFPAALSKCDIDRGDSNAICFGSEHGRIDPDTKGDVELKLQLDKIDFNPKKSRKFVFFKQLDLGFGHIRRNERAITLNNDKKIIFNYTNFYDKDGGVSLATHNGYVTMYICYVDEKASEILPDYPAVSYVHSLSLISYNIDKIDSILILNFFKFLDNMVSYENGDADSTVASIYDALDKMNDNELAGFLREVGCKMSDTMEFNFYGAHLINFDSLISIKDINNQKNLYMLSMSDFIIELEQGKLDLLKEAKERFPQIFQSYRFVDYLLSKTEHPDARNELLSFRLNCKSPGWHPNYSAKSVNAQATSSQNTSEIALLARRNVPD